MSKMNLRETIQKILSDNPPMTIDEICHGLKNGGFEFEEEDNPLDMVKMCVFTNINIFEKIDRKISLINHD